MHNRRDDSPVIENAAAPQPAPRERTATYGEGRSVLLEEYFAHIADAIFVTQLDGQIVDANPAVCALLGYSRAQLMTMHPWDFVISASREEILEKLSQLQRGIAFTVQRTYRRADGTSAFVDLCLTRFAHEERDLAIVSCRNITERHRLQTQLRESEKNLAEGQRLTKTGTWVLDLQTHELECSLEFCRILGFPETSFFPNLSELIARIHPDDGDLMRAMLEDSSRWQDTTPWNFRYLMPDGVSKHIESTRLPVRDASGEVVKQIGTVMDVTQRHLAEAALRASEELARGQVRALTRTLDAMAQESSPDLFLEHVLATIIEQMGAYNISVWQRIEDDCLEGFEYSREQAKCKAPHDRPVRISLMPQDSPEWEEIVRTGHCTVCDDIAQVAMLPHRERLMAQGVVTSLLVPLLVAGEVAGMIGVRFDHRHTFRDEELELAQALAHQATLALQLTRLSQQSRHAAIVAERNRFARDMHDTLAQGFTGVIVQLEAAKDATSKGLDRAADHHVHRAGEMARCGLGDARRSVLALRPQALEHNDLSAALQALIEYSTQGTTLQAALLVEGKPRALPLHFDEHILNIGREALTNTLRHARATQFAARLRFDEEKLALHLNDNGCGFDATKQRGGWGLRGIRERVAEIGGTLTMHSAPEHGTALCIVLPLDDKAPDS